MPDQIIKLLYSLIRLLILIVSFKNLSTFGKNIDTNNPILFQLPQSSRSIHSSLFGHSVLMNDNDNGPM